MTGESTQKPSPTTLGRFSWLLGRPVRLASLALLLIGFAVFVGIYMHIVNRYVHFSIRVYASQVAEPGGSVVMRVTLYQPGMRRLVTGTATIEQLDSRGRPIDSRSAPVNSESLVPFRFELGRFPSEEVLFRVTVAAQEEEEVRTYTHRVSVQPLENWLYDMPLPRARDVASWPGIVHPTDGFPGTQGFRLDPADAPICVELTAEGGVPVRFLENRFFVRLSGRDGEPLAFHRAAVHLGDDADSTILGLRTDRQGLAEFRALPEDLAVWRVETELDESRVTAWFEIVPSWDGLSLHVTPALVAAEQGFDLLLATRSRSERWHYDIFTDRTWIATGTLSLSRPGTFVWPPGGTWMPNDSSLRLLLVETYSNPFSVDPQRSVRGVLIKPRDVADSEAARSLLEAFENQGIEREYVTALLRLNLPLSTASAEELARLIEYLFAMARLPHHIHDLVYDDTESQTATLRSQIERFRRRANGVLILGSIALLVWIAGRVGFGMWQTRRRTRKVMAEMAAEDVDLELKLTGTFGANVGPAAILWVLIALGTLGAFCVGLIWLLTLM